MKGIDFTGIAILAGLALAAAAAYAVWKNGPAALATVAEHAKEASAAAVDAINPTSSTNLAARASNAVVSAATGTEATLGTWIYDLFHADELSLLNQQAPISATSRALAPDSLPPLPF